MTLCHARLFFAALLLLGTWALPVSARAQGGRAQYEVANRIEIDRVPSGFPVRFYLLTLGDRQYAAYYNADHQMVVADRPLGETSWRRTELPTRIGWDSHNSVTMAADSEGRLHLAGNMHCVPLIYFRTRDPGDPTTFERQPMVGRDEQRCTYPRFFRDNDGSLLFMYRSGGSGNGHRLVNIHDAQADQWHRLLDMPLLEGEGERNAYPHGPVQGPDGRFHMIWVWRDTPDCATNHHLCYARSDDFRTWESAGGQPLPLPITLDEPATWVDPAPTGSGMINGGQRLAFDSRQQPVIAYHRADERGHMQIYVARFDDGTWQSRLVTNWGKEVQFGGRGAMPFIGIRLGFRHLPPNRFVIDYRHRDYGAGQIVLDDETLQAVDEQIDIKPKLPRRLSRPTIDFPGMRVHLLHADGDVAVEDGNRIHVLRWETLGPNHDRPRQPPLPPDSPLELIELQPRGADG